MIRYALVFVLFASAAAAQSVFTSSTAAQVQAHCPSDTVVWLNTDKHIYRLPGQKGYGRAKSSAYACESEANAAGDRAKKVKTAPSAGTPADGPPANSAS